jgi:hypothetical protein
VSQASRNPEGRWRLLPLCQAGARESRVVFGHQSICSSFSASTPSGHRSHHDAIGELEIAYRHGIEQRHTRPLSTATDRANAPTIELRQRLPPIEK